MTDSTGPERQTSTPAGPLSEPIDAEQGEGSAPLLEARGIAKHFAGVQALDNVQLTLHSGEILALVGENGAGKSTLIKILSGAIKRDAGEILMHGRPIQLHEPSDADRHGIVTVYQELSLFPTLTVAENLFLGHYPRRGAFIDWRRMRQEAAQSLAKLGVSLDVDRRVFDLSIAERYMVEIGKAVRRSARVMILDEPTAVLGGHDVDELIRIVKSLRDHGVGVIFISHRLDEIFGLANAYVVLKDGKWVGEGRIEDTNHDDLVSKMVGRALGESIPRSQSDQPKRELLRVSGLSRDGVLKDINLTLHAGEVLGIAGLRGAGRTELARAIFGADPIDSGSIFLKGREARVSSPTSAIRRGIGLVPEDRGTQGLFKNLSSAQNIALVKIAGFGSGWVSPAGERRSAEKYVQKLRIKVADVGLSVGTLSGGNQQKVVLAKWLEAGVSVLILDEPTRGIDVGSKRQIYELIRDLCETGLGIIVISSELPEILEVSDRILVMHGGRIAAELDRPEATEEIIMYYAVGGSAA